MEAPPLVGTDRRVNAGVVVKMLLAVIFWGASFVGTKVALQDAHPVTVVWVRFLIGVLVLGAAVVGRRQFRLPALRDVGYFALIGALGITWHQWLQSTELLTAQATTSAWIVASTPIFMALLGWIFFKETLSLLRVAGIFIAAFGVLLVVTHGDLRSLGLGKFGTQGDLLMLISSPNWAVFSALSRNGLRRYPAALMMLYVMAFGWIFTSGLFFAGPGLADLKNFTLNGWAAVLYLGIACSGLAYIFYYDALQVMPAARVGVFLYIEPLVTVGVASLLIGEKIFLATLAGGAIILLGVWLVNRRG